MDDADLYAAAASDLLFNATGRQFVGLCELVVTTRDEHGLCIDGLESLAYRERRARPRSNEYDMGGAYPVRSITYVEIEGVVIDATTYHVEDYRWLVRHDDVAWPRVMTIALTFGTPPPPLGELAAKRLGCELALACNNDVQCKIPRNVQSVVRQGITYAMKDLVSLVTSGSSGIWEVDMLVTTYNPGRLTEQPGIVTPDTIRPWSTTTWSDGS